MRRLILVALVLLVATPLLAHSPAADSYVVRLGDITYMNGKGMSGEALKELQTAYGQRFFWFKRGGHAYVVKAGQEIERAEAILVPEMKVSRKQAAIGQKQAGLGSEQAGLGARQATLGGRQAAAGSDDRAQNDLSRQQEALSKQQEELSRKQEVLSREQDKLGNEQDRVSALVEKQLGELADQCIRSGVAKEVGR